MERGLWFWVWKSENTSGLKGWGSVFLNTHRRCRQTNHRPFNKMNRQMAVEPETESRAQDNRLSIWYSLNINA